MKRRILIAGGHEADQERLKDILSCYDVITDVTCQDTIRILRKPNANISAVLLHSLGKRTGWMDILVQMRAGAAFAQIPVIVLSDAADDAARSAALELGAIFFFARPYDPALLRQCLYNIIHLCESIAQERSMHEEERRLLQASLASANEANRVKDKCISRMSHDMRTSMNAIFGMTYLAKEEKPSERVMKYLENIDAASRVLLGLLDDALALGGKRGDKKLP